jgi:serine/threonine protein kinase
MELRVGNKFNFTKKLGKGSFGEIYAGTNVKTGEEVAIKLELANTNRPILHSESLLLKKLSGNRK